MDMDTVWTVAKILFAAYLILWAYNTYQGYRLFTDTETYNGSILAPFIRREPTKLDCAFFALLLGTALPDTRMCLQALWYRFFPPQLPRFEDLKPLDRRK